MKIKDYKELCIKYINVFLKIGILGSLMCVLGLSLMPKKISTEFSNFSEKPLSINLKSGSELKQVYLTNLGDLNHIKFKLMDNDSDINGNLNFELRNENNKKIFTSSIDLTQHQGEFIDIDVGNVKDDLKEQYQIIMQYESPINDSLKLAAYENNDGLVNSSETLLKCSIDGKNSKKLLELSAIGYNNAYHLKTISVFFSIFAILFIIFILKSRKNKGGILNKLANILDALDKKHLLFICEFLLVIVSAFSIFSLLLDIRFRQNINFVKLITTLLITCISILYITLQYFKCKKSYARLFLLLAIPLSISYWLLLLPNYAPDEVVHFLKTYLTSTFDFSNSNLVSIPEEFMSNRITNYNDVIKQVFHLTNYSNLKLEYTASSYHFISYLIPGITMGMARLIHFSIYGSYYLARLANLLLYLYLGHKAIKITPIGKIIFFTLLLNPMVIHQAISLNPDSLLHSVCILFIAYVLHIKFNEEKLTNKNLLFLASFLVFIILAKYLYIPLFAICFIFIDKILKIDKKKLLMFLSICCFGIVLYYLYNYAFSQFVAITSPNDYASIANVNGMEQLKGIINNPLSIFKVFINTLDRYGWNYLITFGGFAMGWLDILQKIELPLIYLILLFMSPFLENERYKLKRNEKLWFIVIFIGISLLIITGMYLFWSGVGAPIAEGVQGRYFIPIILLLLFSYAGNKKVIIKSIPKVYTLTLLFVHYFMILTVVSYFS